MTPVERSTLHAGCIGITALNLGVHHNPPLDEAYSTLAQARTRAAEIERTTGRRTAIFSKHYWGAGQPPHSPPDPATGKVDMRGYDYDRRRPGGFVNFDYGFYDQTTDSWWHANHSHPSDPAERLGNPMKVYQSKQHNLPPPPSGPDDHFDSQVYCVGIPRP